MTEEEALAVLWSAKGAYLTDDRGRPLLDESGSARPNPKWCNAFVYATLECDVPAEHSRTIKSGTRVLVTMVSRFGDVGIRDDRLVPASNGYCARIDPVNLTDWSTEP